MGFGGDEFFIFKGVQYGDNGLKLGYVERVKIFKGKSIILYWIFWVKEKLILKKEISELIGFDKVGNLLY